MATAQEIRQAIQSQQQQLSQTQREAQLRRSQLEQQSTIRRQTQTSAVQRAQQISQIGLVQQAIAQRTGKLTEAQRNLIETASSGVGQQRKDALVALKLSERGAKGELLAKFESKGVQKLIKDLQKARKLAVKETIGDIEEELQQSLPEELRDSIRKEIAKQAKIDRGELVVTQTLEPAQQLPGIKVADFVKPPRPTLAKRVVSSVIAARKGLPSPIQTGVSFISPTTATAVSPRQGLVGQVAVLEQRGPIIEAVSPRTRELTTQLSQVAREGLDPKEKRIAKFQKQQAELNKEVAEFNIAIEGKDLPDEEFTKAQAKIGSFTSRQEEIEEGLKKIQEERRTETFTPIGFQRQLARGAIGFFASVPESIVKATEKPATTLLSFTKTIEQIPQAIIERPVETAGAIGVGFLGGNLFLKAATKPRTVALTKGGQVIEGIELASVKRIPGGKFEIEVEALTISPSRTRVTQTALQKVTGATTTKVAEAQLRRIKSISKIVVDESGNILRGQLAGRKIGGVGIGRTGPINVFELAQPASINKLGQAGVKLTREQQFLLQRLGRGGVAVVPEQAQLFAADITTRRVARVAPSQRSIFIPRPGRTAARTQGLIASIELPGTQGRVIKTVSSGLDATFPILRLDRRRLTVRSQGRTFVLNPETATVSEASGGGVLKSVQIGDVPPAVLKTVEQIKKAAVEATAKPTPTPSIPIPKPTTGTAAVVTARLQAQQIPGVVTPSTVSTPQQPPQQLGGFTQQGIVAPQATLDFIQDVQKVPQATAFSTQLLTSQALQPVSGVQQVFVAPQLQIPTVTTRPSIKITEDVAQVPSVGLAQIPALAQLQLQVPTQELEQATIGVTVTPPITRPTVTPVTPSTSGGLVVPKPTGSLLMSAVQKLKGRGIAYDVFVKRMGKYKKVAEDLPIGKALKKGARVTKETLAASFKIVRDKKADPKSRDISFTPDPEIFRRFKIVGGKRVSLPQGPEQFEFIEKRGKRLTTKTETREIQTFRKSRRTGGLLAR